LRLTAALFGSVGASVYVVAAQPCVAPPVLYLRQTPILALPSLLIFLT
jgi:hypothetical protein